MSLKIHIAVLGTLLTCFCRISNAQVLPVAMLNDDVRREQLLGKFDSSASFNVLPFVAGNVNRGALKSGRAESAEPLFTDRFTTKRLPFFALRALPFTLKQQVMSDHPYSWNDESMIPSRGYQALATGGVYVKAGPLSIQLKPEWVWAQNANFNGFPREYSDSVWSVYYRRVSNVADLPEKFGRGNYHKVKWGQSAIRLTAGPVSLGYSNENLWWGPGMRNSIIMSNTATGFRHFTLNTVRPVNIGVGTLEGQIIAGNLNASGYLPPGTDRSFEDAIIYQAKNDDSRYVSAMILNYHPRWVPGLFIGITRVFYMYDNDRGSKLSDYIPLLSPFEKAKTGDAGVDDARNRDQLTSVFARWVFKEAHAEAYFELGRNDHSVTLRDFTLEPEHSRAFVAGFSKVFPISHYRFVQFKSEITQLAIPDTYLIRDYPNWYVHHQVREGYTNQGEILGAGIGSGSTLRSFDLTYGNGFKKLGLQVESYRHNQDFYNQAFAGSVPSRKWNDLSFSAHGSLAYQGILFNAELQGVQSSNYQWKPGNGVFNFIVKLAATYSFY